MNIEKLIKDFVSKMGSMAYISIAPNIDPKKINNARDNICGGESFSEDLILAIADASVFGNVAIGMLFLGDGFYYANKKKSSNYVLYSNILSVIYITDKDLNEYSSGDILKIKLKDGTVHELIECMAGINCRILESLFKQIISLGIEGVEFSRSEQNIPISDLSDELKLVYMKILVNYLRLEGCSYEDEKYQLTLQKIIVRIELHPASRIALVDYLGGENQEKSRYLIFKLKNELKEGCYDIVRYSLIQDSIYLYHNIIGSYPSNREAFEKFSEALEISKEQVEIMKISVELNESLISLQKDNLNELGKRIEKVRFLAKDRRIPLMVLICSGSVYSTDTYYGLKKLEKQKESINKQRELMLQAVIGNSQKAINNLVIDINEITGQLIKAINDRNLNTEKINKLTAAFARLTAQTNSFASVADSANIQVRYNQIPKQIKLSQWNSFPDKTLLDACYSYNTQIYELKDNISNDNINRLYNLFGELNLLN